MGSNPFAGGIGLDHIGVILCSILNHHFFSHVQQEATRLQIQMNRVKGKHARLEQQRARWSPNAKILLNKGGGVLLAPERFIKDIPVVAPEDPWK